MILIFLINIDSILVSISLEDHLWSIFIAPKAIWDSYNEGTQSEIAVLLTLFKPWFVDSNNGAALPAVQLPGDINVVVNNISDFHCWDFIFSISFTEAQLKKGIFKTASSDSGEIGSLVTNDRGRKFSTLTIQGRQKFPPSTKIVSSLSDFVEFEKPGYLLTGRGYLKYSSKNLFDFSYYDFDGNILVKIRNVESSS